MTQSSTMMHAVRVHRYGGPDQLQLDEIPRPRPGPDEILVRIHAAGVLPIETAVRSGRLAQYMPKTLPYIPGTAFSGIIDAVGGSVTGFQVGDAICGRAPNGTYAEYVTVPAMLPPPPADANGISFSGQIVPLALKPEMLAFDDAATLSGGATTAWTSLFEDGGLSRDQHVLIHAAAGGVGLFAVQLAKWAGARVTATCGSNNVEYVRSLGADTVIDYTATRFEDVAGDVDLVLDAVGGDTLTRSMRVVRRGGTLVSIMGDPPQDLARELGIRAIKNAVFPTSDHLRRIIGLIAEGHVKPCVRQVFPLHEAPAAHALAETGHGRGRVVLRVANAS